MICLVGAPFAGESPHLPRWHTDFGLLPFRSLWQIVLLAQEIGFPFAVTRGPGADIFGEGRRLRAGSMMPSGHEAIDKPRRSWCGMVVDLLAGRATRRY